VICSQSLSDRVKYVIVRYCRLMGPLLPLECREFLGTEEMQWSDPLGTMTRGYINFDNTTLHNFCTLPPKVAVNE